MDHYIWDQTLAGLELESQSYNCLKYKMKMLSVKTCIGSFSSLTGKIRKNYQGYKTVSCLHCKYATLQ